MAAPSDPLTITLTPGAVDVLRAWATRFQSARVPDTMGLGAVGLELGYGKGAHRAAARALAARLDAGTFPHDVWGRIAFLVFETSEPTWAALRDALDSDTWARTYRAVDLYRAERRFDPSADDVPLKSRQGRPIRSHRLKGAQGVAHP